MLAVLFFFQENLHIRRLGPAEILVFFCGILHANLCAFSFVICSHSAGNGRSVCCFKCYSVYRGSVWFISRWTVYLFIRLTEGGWPHWLIVILSSLVKKYIVIWRLANPPVRQWNSPITPDDPITNQLACERNTAKQHCIKKEWLPITSSHLH